MDQQQSTSSSSSSFYVVLPSNTLVEGNTSSNFIVRLPNVIELDGGGWTVALSSIVYPISFATIGTVTDANENKQQQQFIKIIYKEGGGESLTIPIPSATFQSAQFLERFLNSLINSALFYHKSGNSRGKRSTAANTPSSGEALGDVEKKLQSAKNAAAAARREIAGYADAALKAAQDAEITSKKAQQESKGIRANDISDDSTRQNFFEADLDVTQSASKAGASATRAHNAARQAAESEEQIHTVAVRTRDVKMARIEADKAKTAVKNAKEAQSSAIQYKEQTINDYNKLHSIIAKIQKQQKEQSKANKVKDDTKKASAPSTLPPPQPPQPSPPSPPPPPPIHVLDENKDQTLQTQQKQQQLPISDREKMKSEWQLRRREQIIKILDSRALKNDFDLQDGSIYFYYDEEVNKFYFISRDSLLHSVELPMQLAYVLGFESSQIFREGYAKYMPDMSGGIRQFYVYAPSLVEDTVVGDTTAPLLRVINIQGKPGEVAESIYTSEYHCRLTTKRISQVRIQIRSSTGHLIDFHWGNCIITLHFKRSLF
jgi:phage pi2 protein 07